MKGALRSILEFFYLKGAPGFIRRHDTLNYVFPYLKGALRGICFAAAFLFIICSRFSALDDECPFSLDDDVDDVFPDDPDDVTAFDDVIEELRSRCGFELEETFDDRELLELLLFNPLLELLFLLL